MHSFASETKPLEHACPLLEEEPEEDAADAEIQPATLCSPVS